MTGPVVVALEPHRYVRHLRLEKNWKQQDVADAVGISRVYISMLETGAKKADSVVEMLVEFLESAPVRER